MLRLPLAVLLTLFAAIPSLGQLTTADWLVYLARDHAIGLKGAQTEQDVTHIRTLLEAALRLDPDLPMAHRWLYELDTLQGEPAAARKHLERLVGLEPENETVWHQWLRSGAVGQNLQQRTGWLEQQRGRATTPVQQAELQVALAEVALERLDLTAAGKHLVEARRLAPTIPGLARLEAELLGPEASAEQRAGVLLRALTANPVQVDAPWRLGVLLDEVGLHDEARTFYEHAVSVHEATAPERDVPAEYLRQLSRNALARGDREAAVRYAKRAATRDRGSYSSSFYLLWLFEATEQTGQARVLKDQLAERFDEVKEPADWPVELVAAVAWYHCALDPQPERAKLLADSAYERAADDPFVRRVHGWSLASQGDTAGAEAALKPLAAFDPLAGAKLVELLVNAGRGDEARAVVGAMRGIEAAGPARAMLEQVGLSSATSQPVGSVESLLAGFDRQVLLFHHAPWRFLVASVRPVDVAPGVGEPWWIELRLANQGPFAISLGPDEMVNPTFLLSFELEGDKERAFPGLLTVSVDQKRVLAPGESVSVRRVLDLGPLRTASFRTPQQLQRISIRGWLDPQRLGSGWRASPTGQELTRVSLNRRPMLTTREAWHAVFAGLTSENATRVYRSIEALAGLLAESQYARLGRLSYEPAPIPVEKVHSSLLEALRSPIWQVRVRALGSLQWTGFDAEMLAAVRECLEHEHWLVRLMAVRLLGSRLGSDFATRAGEIAAGDADEQVRLLSGGYAGAGADAATAPADGPR